ncbi:hypothetical protein SCOCK_70237 [Actinacidiphila cocklensis]|uniref:Uncharacterized protein n=1 Tax=Actinacidiphila cocklensis TaxID=887465 RepID=A0A9W4DYX4_9ACTN|nr:hypothetical protein SCOCK_70237 [Actinacidiphila cocklensis]
MHDKNVGLAHRAARAHGMPSDSRIGTGPDHWSCRAGLADISACGPRGPFRARSFVPPRPLPCPPPRPLPRPLPRPPSIPPSIPQPNPPLRPAVAVSPSVAISPPPITTDAHSHHCPATSPVRLVLSRYTLPDWFPPPTLPFGLENLSGSINVR